MEELVAYIERTPKAKHATKWKNFIRSLPPPLCNSKAPKTWQTAYNMKAINEAISYTQMVAYNETIVSFSNTNEVDLTITFYFRMFVAL